MKAISSCREHTLSEAELQNCVSAWNLVTSETVV